MICQITGWAFVSLAFSTYAIFNGGTNATYFFYIGKIFLFGITVTHLFRNFILKRNWLALPVRRAIGRLLLALLVLSFIMGIAHAVAGALFNLIANQQPFNLVFSLVAGRIADSFILLCSWTLIYCFYCYVRKTRIENIERQRLELRLKLLKPESETPGADIEGMTNLLNRINELIGKNPESARDE